MLYINSAPLLSRRPNPRPPDSPYLRHSQITDVARLRLLERASERGDVIRGLSVHNFSRQAVLSEAGVRSMKPVRSGDPKWPRQSNHKSPPILFVHSNSTQVAERANQIRMRDTFALTRRREPGILTPHTSQKPECLKSSTRRHSCDICPTGHVPSAWIAHIRTGSTSGA